MNFWQSLHLNSSIKRIISILLCIICLNAKEISKEQLLSLFSILEDKDTTKELQTQTIKRIIDLGVKVEPYVEERLASTKNPHYFYILQQLSESKDNTWSKADYFYQHYQSALLLAKQEKYTQAIAIIKAILVLEKDLHFQQEMKKALQNIENKKKRSSEFITTNAYASLKYFSFQDKLNIVIAIKNNGFQPITLTCGKKYLDLKITSTKFFLSGDSRTEISTKTPRIEEKITIKGGKWWKAEISIPQERALKECYQQLEVEAQINLVTLKKAGKNHFPKVDFPKAMIKILPKKYHVVVVNPIAYFKGAVSKNYPRVLFYTSFFIRKKNHKHAIAFLIENLEKTSLTPLVKSILVRFTHQDFPTIRRWKNWWRARNWALK
ncbi:hypothetical protein [Candidatus Uabimicrobium amorphum]|uniref:Uncharacterized protein n=1 Tax=Uabimicrobium amorphum TaxID=2596890 RepID=A0A5S9F7N7_UABAM|nr:hypothetical protein [Candidatus Uabimicrobium amorphum]BBM87432.1 hypothetical protein UABAM_05841 [Candidatus Uabimicrobium amorphum]